MKKFIISIALVLIIVAAMIAINDKPEENVNGKEIIKIGVIYPLSSTYSYIGNSHKYGLEFALEDIKKEKKLKHNYELIFEDNQMDGKKTAIIAHKMVNVDKVNAIFSMDSDSGNILNSVLGDKDIFMSGWMSDPKIQERFLSFPYGGDMYEEAELMALKMKENDVEKVNVFLATDSYHMSQKLSIEEMLKKYNIAYDIFNFNSGEKDFRTMISKSKNTGADMNVIGSYSPDIDILARQLIEMKADLPATALEDFAYVENKTPFEGQWFVMPAEVKDAEFLARIKERLGDDTTNHMEITYEVFKSFIEICESEDSFDANKVAQKFIDSQYIDSKLIGKFEITPSGYISTPSSLGIIRDGKIETLE